MTSHNPMEFLPFSCFSVLASDWKISYDGLHGHWSFLIKPAGEPRLHFSIWVTTYLSFSSSPFMISVFEKLLVHALLPQICWVIHLWFHVALCSSSRQLLRMSFLIIYRSPLLWVTGSGLYSFRGLLLPSFLGFLVALASHLKKRHDAQALKTASVGRSFPHRWAPGCWLAVWGVTVALDLWVAVQHSEGPRRSLAGKWLGMCHTSEGCWDRWW